MYAQSVILEVCHVLPGHLTDLALQAIPITHILQGLPLSVLGQTRSHNLTKDLEDLISFSPRHIINSEEDEEDEEPRPAKRRKRNSQLTRQTSIHVERHTLQSSRSPSARRESVNFAEYQEWPFQGFLKRTRIGNETTYNLEFKLPRMSEPLSLPIGACDNEDMPTTPTMRPEAPSKLSTATSRPRTRARWTPEDDAKLVGMKKRGCSWKEINATFPDRTPGTIQVRCSRKLKSRLAGIDFNRPAADAS